MAEDHPYIGWIAGLDLRKHLTGAGALGSAKVNELGDGERRLEWSLGVTLSSPQDHQRQAVVVPHEILISGGEVAPTDGGRWDHGGRSLGLPPTNPGDEDHVADQTIGGLPHSYHSGGTRQAHSTDQQAGIDRVQ